MRTFVPCDTIAPMETIGLHSSGAAVEDVQQRLVSLGLLSESSIDGVFGEETAAAVRAFRVRFGLEAGGDVTDKVWAALVDATYQLGDRTLYLHVPYFHGNDVLKLQQVLGALGFSCGAEDGIFGAYTEDALRKFQLNMGLPSDGIAGGYTFAAVRNLHHSWEGKPAIHMQVNLGFARAADVLEKNALCLFGTDAFTRSVAARMSNLSLATTPTSKIVSADSLLVAPDAQMLLVHIVLPGSDTSANVPRVEFQPESTLALRLASGLKVAKAATPARIAVELPADRWEDAGEGRSAQHFAITLLDALCVALA